MSPTTSFSISLDPDLQSRFDAAAKASHRTAEDLILEFMQDYIAQHDQEDGYDTFLADKVAAARASIKAGRLIPNEEIEREFALLRSSL